MPLYTHELEVSEDALPSYLALGVLGSNRNVLLIFFRVGGGGVGLIPKPETLNPKYPKPALSS